MNSIGGSQDDNDTGAPLPDFSNASRISLNTISPGLGIYNAKNSSYNQPDYLEYDIKGRGIMVTMFANAGMSYLLGITGGSLYGMYYTATSSPSTRFRVQLNSLLNNCGRYGSKLGNTAGIFAIFYSFYENLADNVSIIISLLYFYCFVYAYCLLCKQVYVVVLFLIPFDLFIFMFRL